VGDFCAKKDFCTKIRILHVKALWIEDWIHLLLVCRKQKRAHCRLDRYINEHVT
jgi:hypothetical protein